MELLALKPQHGGAHAAVPRDPMLDLRRVDRIEQPRCFLVRHAFAGVKIPSVLKAEFRVRGDADLVARNRPEHDGASRQASPVDDDGLARGAQLLVFVDVVSDSSAAMVGDADRCVAGSDVTEPERGDQYSRQALHLPPPWTTEQTRTK